MAKCDIVVVGASAGGVTALREFVGSLPVDYKGSVFIVLHLSPNAPSHLAAILSKDSPLKVVQPHDGQAMKSGTIYVASPDHHLLIENKKILIKRGPKENRFRPSIDALFRSAAYSYGSRVVGILLSGALDDGTSGLWSIKRMGGTCIVQDPNEAQFPEMPKNALEYVQADHTMPVSQMGPLLKKLSLTNISKKHVSTKERKLLEMEVTISKQDNAFKMKIMELGDCTSLTCPECKGSLIRLNGNPMRYRCHTGHAYTASSLLAGISETIEDTIWQSMRALEESTMLLNDMSIQFKKKGDFKAGRLFSKKAKYNSKQARIIHDSVVRQEQLSEDLIYKDNK